MDKHLKSTFLPVTTDAMLLSHFQAKPAHSAKECTSSKLPLQSPLDGTEQVQHQMYAYVYDCIGMYVYVGMCMCV